MDSFIAVEQAIKSEAVHEIVLSKEILWAQASYHREISSKEADAIACYTSKDKEDIISAAYDDEITFFNVQQNKRLRPINVAPKATCLTFGKTQAGRLLFIGKENGEIDVFDVDQHQQETTLSRRAFAGAITSLVVLMDGLMVHQGPYIHYYKSVLKEEGYTWLPIKDWTAGTALYQIACSKEGAHFVEAKNGKGVMYHGLEDPSFFQLLSCERLQCMAFSSEHILLGFESKVDIWSFETGVDLHEKVFFEKRYETPAPIEKILPLEGDLEGLVFFKTSESLILYDVSLGKVMQTYCIKESLSTAYQSIFVGLQENTFVMNAVSQGAQKAEKLLKIMPYLIQNAFLEEYFQLLCRALVENKSVSRVSIEEISLTKEMTMQLSLLMRKRTDVEFSLPAGTQEKIELLRKEEYLLKKKRKKQKKEEKQDIKELVQKMEDLRQEQVAFPKKGMFLSRPSSVEKISSGSKTSSGTWTPTAGDWTWIPPITAEILSLPQSPKLSDSNTPSRQSSKEKEETLSEIHSPKEIDGFTCV